MNKKLKDAVCPIMREVVQVATEMNELMNRLFEVTQDIMELPITFDAEEKDED